MTENSILIEYQDALLELMASELTQEEIIEALAHDPRFESYRSYVNDFDPDMVAVARELMGKWARRTSEDSV